MADSERTGKRVVSRFDWNLYRHVSDRGEASSVRRIQEVLNAAFVGSAEASLLS